MAHRLHQIVKDADTFGQWIVTFHKPASEGTRCFQVHRFLSAKQYVTDSYRLLADIPIVSILLVILGVLGKVLVKVHMEERFPSLGFLVEVGEGHGGACDPVKTPPAQ